MLQHLELADRHAELLAGLGIFDRRIEQHLHGAAGLGGVGGDGFVGDLLDERQAVVRLADQIGGRDLDILEGDLASAQAVNGGVVAG